MKRFKNAWLILIFLLATGCAANGGGMGAGLFGANSAEKTLNYPVKDVVKAAHRVLEDMDLLLMEDDTTSGGKTIKAATVDLDIYIELEVLTTKTTRMIVDVKDALTKKHKPLGEDIIEMTALKLDG